MEQKRIKSDGWSKTFEQMGAPNYTAKVSTTYVVIIRKQNKEQNKTKRFYLETVKFYGLSHCLTLKISYNKEKKDGI